MALGQRRMVYTNLWQNPDFAKLSNEAKLLYIGTITVADDDGKLRGNSLLLRSQVFPLDEKVSVEDVRKWLNEIVRSKLITFYKVKNEYYIQHPNWGKYQYIRPDIYKKSKIPSSQKSNRNSTKSLTNINQDKIREGKETSRLEYLKKIPEEDMQEFLKRFDVSRKLILSKAEDFLLYCESKRKTYANYRAALLNAMKRDFEERKTDTPRPRIAAVAPEMTQEERNKAKETMRSIGDLMRKNGVLPPKKEK